MRFCEWAIIFRVHKLSRIAKYRIFRDINFLPFAQIREIRESFYV